MDERGSPGAEVQDLLAGWRDPPGMGKILVASSAIGVVLSLVLITLGMMAAGQVWQSSLALGVFIAFWGGLGFGSMVGGVVYLTRIEKAAKALEAETSTARRTDDAPAADSTAPEPDAPTAEAA